MRFARGVTMVAGLAMVLAACASSGPREGPRYRSDLLTREEIMSQDVRNLFEVVQRLRPHWLQVGRRGDRSFGLTTEIVVFQNQTYLGDVDALRQLAPSFAYQLRWLDGATASAALPGLGSRHVAGAIVISTAPPN